MGRITKGDHQSRNQVSDPGVLQDSKEMEQPRKALITLMAHIEVERIRLRGTKRSPRWDKDASADFRS